MRKIINTTFITLDGVIDRPQDWPALGGTGGGGGEIHAEQILSCDALLMGRHTYDGFAPVWPTRSGDPVSDQFNSMAKYVVSSTLTDPEWNNTTVISGDPVEEIQRLKDAPGKDMIQYGFGQLSFALMEAGLLDELNLWVHPLFVGKAEPSGLLYRDTTLALFELSDTRPLESGVAILSYRYVGSDASAV